MLDSVQATYPWYSEAVWPVSDLICAFISSFLLFQHFAILLKYVIHVAIPDIPTWVQEEMAKLDYQRREAFKVGDNAAQEEDLILHG